MLVIDIETTHLSKDKGHIVEVGIVRLSLGTGGCEAVYNRPIYEEGLTVEELRGSWFYANSDFNKTDMLRMHPLNAPEIQKIIDQDPDGATAYNSLFDFGWLESRGADVPVQATRPYEDLPSDSQGAGQKRED